MSNFSLVGTSQIGKSYGPLTVAFIGDSHTQRMLGASNTAICNPGNDSVWLSLIHI